MFKAKPKILLLAVIIASCNTTAENSTGIEGVYISQFNTEYSITWDTINVSAISKKGGPYFIQHSAGVQHIRNGKLKEKELKETNLIGNWQELSRQLKTEKLGRIYSFPEDGKGLLLGAEPYIKIEN